MEPKKLKFRRASNGWHTSWTWTAKGNRNRYKINAESRTARLFINETEVEATLIKRGIFSDEGTDFYDIFNNLVQLAQKHEDETCNK